MKGLAGSEAQMLGSDRISRINQQNECSVVRKQSSCWFDTKRFRRCTSSIITLASPSINMRLPISRLFRRRMRVEKLRPSDKAKQSQVQMRKQRQIT